MHILDSLNRGGAEMLALDLCRNARANDLDMIMVATGGGDLEADFENAGVPFYRLNRQTPIDIRLARQIRKIMQENHVNLIHAHQAVEALHAYLASRDCGVKRVMTFHLCTSDVKNRFALNLLVRSMDANVAVSHELKTCLKNKGFDTSERFHVVHNGIDQQRLKPGASNAREKLGVPLNALLIGMVANFYPDGRKDQLTVCRALPELFQAVPNAHVLFAGSGLPNATQLFDECKALCHQLKVADRVHFLGKRNDIPDVLHALDIYVHSSVNESLGMAVVEAMLAGVPVVVSDIGALLEVTRNGDFALVFHTGDERDLACKLSALARDPERLQKLALEGKSWATQEFTIQTHISKLIDLYTSI